jgi:hypothetical protein
MTPRAGGSRKWLIAAALLLLAPAAAPHEIVTTQIRLTLHADRTWSASITTAPTSLANKLELEAGERRTTNLSPEAMRAKLERFAPTIARHIDARFDGAAAPAQVSVETLVMPADVTLPAYGVLGVRGSMPAQARAVTWSYDLAYGTYALVFAGSDTAEELTVWIDGDAASSRSRSAPPSTRRLTSRSCCNICGSASCTSFPRASIISCSCWGFSC